MIKKVFILFAVVISLSVNTSVVLAEIPSGYSCGPSAQNPNEPCVKDNCCELDQQNADPNFKKTYSCHYNPTCASFGQIQAPGPLAGLLKTDSTGAGAISKFLSNAVILIYSIAAIVLLFMLLWGAFDWMTSGGEKEKLAAAQQRILNAIIGIILFAVAFAVLAIIGQFTGFTFFQIPIPGTLI